MRKELEDTTIQVAHAGAEKANHADIPRELGVRMFCTASPLVHGNEARWALQVRAPMKIARGREGRDFVVSTASMSIEAIAQLRELCNAAIRDNARQLKQRRRRK